MKFRLLAIALFLCGTVFGQIYTPITPSTYGEHVNRLKGDSVINIPEKDSLYKNTSDTTCQIFLNRKDSSIWAWTKSRGFFKVSGAGGGATDTTGITNFSGKVRSLFSAGYALTYDGNGKYKLDSAANAVYVLRRKDSLTSTNVVGYVTKKILADTSAAIRAAITGGGTTLRSGKGVDVRGDSINLSTNFNPDRYSENALTPYANAWVWTQVFSGTTEMYPDGTLGFMMQKDTLIKFCGGTATQAVDTIWYSLPPYNVFSYYGRFTDTIGNAASAKARWPGDYNYVLFGTKVWRFKNMQNIQLMTSSAPFVPYAGGAHGVGWGLCQDNNGWLYANAGQSNNHDTTTVVKSLYRSKDGGATWELLQSGISWLGGQLTNQLVWRDGFLYILNAGNKQNSLPGETQAMTNFNKKIATTDEVSIHSTSAWIDIPPTPAPVGYSMWGASTVFKGVIIFEGGRDSVGNALGIGGGANTNATVYLDRADRWHILTNYTGLDSSTGTILPRTHAGDLLVWGDVMYRFFGNGNGYIHRLGDTTYISPINIRDRLGIGTNLNISVFGNGAYELISHGVIANKTSDSIIRISSLASTYVLFDDRGMTSGVLDNDNSTVGIPVARTTGNVLYLSKDYHQMVISNTIDSYKYPGERTLKGFGRAYYQHFTTDTSRVPHQTGVYYAGALGAFSETGEYETIIGNDVIANPAVSNQFLKIDASQGSFLRFDQNGDAIIHTNIGGSGAWPITWKARYRFNNTAISPEDDNSYGLGIVGKRWNQLYTNLPAYTPNDTVHYKLVAQNVDGVNGDLGQNKIVSWPVPGSGGSFDTTTIYANLALKLNKSDTASMLANYVRRQELKDTAAALRSADTGVGGGGGSQPANQVVYGTGSGETSSGNFLFDPAVGGGAGGGPVLTLTTSTNYSSIDMTNVAGNFLMFQNTTYGNYIQSSGTKDIGIFMGGSFGTVGATEAVEFKNSGDVQFGYNIYAGGFTVPTASMEAAASTTSKASIRVDAGVAPSSPNDGDIYNKSSTHHLYAYLNGVERQLDNEDAMKVVSKYDNTGLTSTTTNAINFTTPNNAFINVYDIGAHITVTAVTGGVITTTCTYTDETNTSRTITFFGEGLTSAGLTTTGVSNYPASAEITAYPNTAITLTTTLTVGTATYNLSSSLRYVRLGASL